ERIIEELPGVVLYTRKKHGDLLEDVYIYQREKADTTSDIVTRTRAAQARVKWDRSGSKVTFELVNGITERLSWRDVPMFEAGPAIPAVSFVSTNVMQALTNVAPGKAVGVSRLPVWNHGDFGGTQIEIPLTNIDRAERSSKISDMTFWELRQELTKRKQQGISVTPILVQMHRQIAFSFASFAFTLVAIPLGIQAHRRETSIGMAISLILVFVYYSFLILSEALQMREKLHPQFIVWIPNLLFQTLGAILLWRANRKG
ncbi:MAG: LptF/LptG family permease, partial [Limisphaerales bacterium]